MIEAGSGIRLASGALTVVALATLIAPAATAQSQRVAPAVVPTTKVLVVSGSSLAGVISHKTQAGFQGADFTLDLQACRRTSGKSCSVYGKKAPPTVLDVVKSKGAGHSTLVVFAGYNEGTSSLSKGFDQVVAEARAKGITRIVWATLRTNKDYTSSRINALNTTYVASNAMLRTKIVSGLYPDVVLADWDTYSTHDTTWFIKDGIHFTKIGAWAAPDYLSRKIAFLDGRACPQPRKPGEAPENPCPDPDLRPPDVDLVAQYPVGTSLTCFEVAADQHIECRPNAKVNAISQTLQFGMTGNEVKALQTELKARGFMSSVTKKYDRRTLEAVMTYQQRRGLPVSGVAGPSTRAELGFGCKEVPALGSACPSDSSPVQFVVPTKQGNSGPLVRMLQNRLHDLGYFNSKVNGSFGTSTRTAVKAFQTANALPVTGIVNGPTAAALGYGPVP